MDPFSFFALALQGVGTFMGIKGAQAEAEAFARASEYNARLLEENAKLAESASREEERRSRVMATKELGSIRAAVGGSGITMSGSALDIMYESSRNAELNALTIQHEGRVRAWTYRNEATLERNKARIARETGAYEAAAAAVSGGAGILRDLPSIGGRGYGYSSGGGYGYSSSRSDIETRPQATGYGWPRPRRVG